MKITIKEMYRKKRAMELRDKVCENDPLYMVYDFDPRETSFETWMGFYDEFHDFIPELTKKRFKDILREHRTLYNFREDIKWWRDIQHPMRAIFEDEQFIDRLFLLKPTVYGEWTNRILKKRKGKKADKFFLTATKPTGMTDGFAKILVREKK